MTEGLQQKNGAPIPLVDVEIGGEVLGGEARLVVSQRYRNDEAKPIEAVYTFPLPTASTLVGFSMTANGRRLEGVVKAREDAFKAYDDAITAGHGAALLEQERRNVFTASVGSILPGEEVVIAVAIALAVPSDEGALRLAIPTLVAPRYIPGKPDARAPRTARWRPRGTYRTPIASRPRAAPRRTRCASSCARSWATTW